MNFAFATPAALALLAVAPLLLLLRARAAARRPRAAPDFELWRRAAEKLGDPPRRRAPRRDDLLPLLPFALWVIAAAGPRLERAGSADVVAIVDRTASMGVTDAAGRTRVARGLAEARRLLGGASLEIVGAPAPPEGVDPETPSAAGGDPADLAAEAERRRDAGRRVVVVTDRDDVALPAGVGRVTVADDALNAGVVACAVREGAGLLVRVEGRSATPRRLVVASDAGEIARYDVPADAPLRAVVPVDVRARLAVRLDPPDALPLDDVVHLVPEAAPTRVAVVAERADALVRALRAQPDVEVSFGPDPEAALAVVRDASTADASRAAWLVPPFPPTHGFALGAARAVDAPGVGFGRWEGYSTDVTHWPAVFDLASRPDGAETLLAAGDAPLLVRSGGVVAWTVDPEIAPWIDVASFPLTVRRLLDDAGLAALATTGVRRAGDVAVVPGRGAATAVWTSPPDASGRRAPPRALEADGDGRFRFTPDAAGVHVLETGGARIEVAVAVLDAMETAARRAAASVSPPEEAAPVARVVDLGAWAAAAGLAACAWAFAAIAGPALRRRPRPAD
ncbi:MAG TPA: hypothetical protein VEI02_13835 [Planctomycetota bacterium]|nr:hypothetical protein [Planctomycetota bacterium]